MTAAFRERALKSTEWLAAHLGAPNLRVVDGSFHLPASGRDAAEEYAQLHIPGALFFDIDGICDVLSPWPHMLPSPDDFAVEMSGLGIGNDDIVVAYDAEGSLAAPRVWWTFRVFGHREVFVLDGGLAKWRAEGRPVDDRPPPFRQSRYEAGFNPALVRDTATMLANLAAGAEQVVDNRGAGRFAGRDPEPRPVKKLGHIPGSLNIPFSEFVDGANFNRWRCDADLASVFERAGVDLGRPIVGTCGSGVTACTTAFAAFLLGHDDVAVYDGAWAEWGNRDDTPVA